MTKFAGKGETKFLVAGLGWASAELLMTRVVPLWVGARSVEFDWKYLQMSFDSNISLVSILFYILKCCQKSFNKKYIKVAPKTVVKRLKVLLSFVSFSKFII